VAEIASRMTLSAAVTIAAISAILVQDLPVGTGSAAHTTIRAASGAAARAARPVGRIRAGCHGASGAPAGFGSEAAISA
jgi:hypothetical protein